MEAGQGRMNLYGPNDRRWLSCPRYGRDGHVFFFGHYFEFVLK